MTTLLLIETATPVCSVALARDGVVLAELHSDEPNAHSSQLSPFINQLFAQCGMAPAQVDAVCVSSGPGSYTGLRIGVSTAKGRTSRPAVPVAMSREEPYWVCMPTRATLLTLESRRRECFPWLWIGCRPVISRMLPISNPITSRILWPRNR